MTRTLATAPRRLGRVTLATLALGLIALVFTACGAKSNTAALTGETWRLTSITEKTPAFQGVVPEADQDRYTIEFNRDGTFDGTADCNAVGGTYTTSGKDGLSIVVGPSTKVACPEGSIGDTFVAALGNATTYDIVRERLTITLKDGGTLVFSGASLTGVTWQLGAITQTEPAFLGVVPPGAQSRYTILFNEDDSFSATADCNTVAGAYSTTRLGGMTITPGPSTMVACPEGSLGDAYVLALRRAASYAITNNQLTITLAGGGTMTFTAAAPEPSAEPSASAAVTVTASPTATPAPTATPTARPTATPVPTINPTATPATPVETAKPTSAPTATPAPTTKTCKTSDGSITVTYPANWFTVTEPPEFACLFFDPQPIVIDVDTGQPVASVRVAASATVTYDEALLSATDTKLWKGISQNPATVSGLPATKLTAVANGAGSYPAGTARYGYLVDRGANGIVAIGTTAVEGDGDFITNSQVVDQIATSIVITP